MPLAYEFPLYWMNLIIFIRPHQNESWERLISPWGMKKKGWWTKAQVYVEANPGLDVTKRIYWGKLEESARGSLPLPIASVLQPHAGKTRRAASTPTPDLDTLRRSTRSAAPFLPPACTCLARGKWIQELRITAPADNTVGVGIKDRDSRL